MATTMVRWEGPGWYAGACTNQAWVEAVDFEWVAPNSNWAGENARLSGLGTPVLLNTLAEAQEVERKCNSNSI